MPSQIQRVWDLPTRAFHWMLAVLIALQYATGEFHFLDMRWHFWFGYATLALIAFRVLWGILGSQTSRFADFLRGPAAVWRYLRSQSSTNPQTRVGHNPLGGWSVIALLASVAVQAVSGLFASDDIDTDGPFVAHVADATVKLMTRVHHWNESVLLVLVGLHIAAVLLYLVVKRDNLIAPMLSGRKKMQDARPLRFVSAWRALALFALCAAAVVAMVWWAG
ncbi:MAG TPA: cytochrome b/b6 domain-containing protein [Rudaea sp.]|nr:cytochrome b/b6 domain-containing protein [Rudaea sp.]